MAVWLVRAGRYGETEDIALEKGVAVLGWDALPDLSEVETREDLGRIMWETYPNEKADAVSNWLSQVWAFRGRIKVGDLVVLPIRSRSAIAIGRVTGPYQYRTDLGEGAKHTRPVNWLHADLPPVAFDKDLLYAFGAFMTVSHISCDRAEQRIEAVLRENPHPDHFQWPAAPRALIVRQWTAGLRLGILQVRNAYWRSYHVLRSRAGDQ